MRACRKYWFTAVSSLVSTALSSLMIEGSPFMSRAFLLGGETEGLLAVLDESPHIADAFSTLGRALSSCEHFARAGRAGLDGRGDVAFANTVTVADVHGRSGP